MASDLEPPAARPAQLPPGFDGLQYIASHGDLIQTFGADRAAGEQHYLAFGEAEGRVPDGFDQDAYLARYPDLQAAFGDDGQAATVHYIQFGFAEGRTDVDLGPGPGPGPGPAPGGNEPPVFTSPAAVSVEENTTAVLTLAADDPEGGDVAFRLVEGADAELFQITGDDQLVFVAPPDFENPGDADGNNVYRVLVRADDDNVGGTSRQDFAITVTNVDEPPGGQPLGGVAALDFLF